MKLFAPSDSLMRTIRQMMSLRMTSGIGTDEFALLVRNTYRSFHAETTRMCPPIVDIIACLWECRQLRTFENCLTPELKLKFRKEDPPSSFNQAMQRARKHASTYLKSLKSAYTLLDASLATSGVATVPASSQISDDVLASRPKALKVRCQLTFWRQHSAVMCQRSIVKLQASEEG